MLRPGNAGASTDHITVPEQALTQTASGRSASCPMTREPSVSAPAASSPDFSDRQAHVGEMAADQMANEWGDWVNRANPSIPLLVGTFAREASTAQDGATPRGEGRTAGGPTAALGGTQATERGIPTTPGVPRSVGVGRKAPSSRVPSLRHGSAGLGDDSGPLRVHDVLGPSCGRQDESGRSARRRAQKERSVQRASWAWMTRWPRRYALRAAATLSAYAARAESSP